MPRKRKKAEVQDEEQPSAEMQEDLEEELPPPLPVPEDPPQAAAPATSPDKKLRREANYELKLMLAVEKSQAKYLRAAERDFRVAHKVMEAKEARIDRDKSASEESKMLRVFKAMNTLREKEAAFNRELRAMLVVKFQVSQAQIVCKDLEIARLARIVRCQKKRR